MIARALRAAMLASGLAAAAALAQTPSDRAEWPKIDFAKRTVDLAEIESGGPPKDGIPAIDRPRFVSTRIARTWLKPREPVIVVRLGVPIRQGENDVALAVLDGSVVSVAYVDEKGGIVARSIEVLKMPAPSPGS